MPTPYGSSKKPKPKKARASSPSPAPKPAPGEKTAGYEREHRHPSGTEWNRKKSNVISAYNGICCLCDHPGSLQVDHVVAFAETQDNSIGNLRPVHGVAKNQNNRCPVCNLACNNIRGSLSFEAGRAKVQRRIGNAPPPDQDNGRDWLYCHV